VAKSLTITRYRLLSEIVYDRLRQAIMFGELRPGERLRQEKLANQMGVSRMPVREALHRLAKEGLVEFPPHRGAVVRRPTLQEFRQIFDALEILERAALELVVRNITDGEIDALQRLQEAMAEGMCSGRTADVVYLNLRFHRALTEACRLPKLCECIESLWNWYPVASTMITVTRGADAVAEHDDILAALRTREPARVHAAYFAHLEGGVCHMMDMLKLPQAAREDERATGQRAPSGYRGCTPHSTFLTGAPARSAGDSRLPVSIRAASQASVPFEPLRASPGPPARPPEGFSRLAAKMPGCPRASGGEIQKGDER
jgi:DNA-binding GntR family transcriptional regulator